MRSSFFRVIGLVILTVFSSLSGCEKPVSQEYGYLEGIIRIGPLCPVETDPPSSDCLPTAETYKAYPVAVWTSDGSKRVSTLSPSLDGSFSVRLPAGMYLVKLVNLYGAGGSNLPVEVVINALEKTMLDIEIDTGIR